MKQCKFNEYELWLLKRGLQISKAIEEKKLDEAERKVRQHEQKIEQIIKLIKKL